MTAELARRATDAGRLAIDTEFMSERRYQAMLCLAQLAVADPGSPGGVRTDILDPIEDELDVAPLAAALADPAVEVVVHAGRQDVAILRRTWETDIRNVFDTQVAAGFLGYGVQEGYGSLVRKVLGVEPAGGEAFTHWDRRPLTDRQLEYARADAAHLLALGDALVQQLAAAGRLGEEVLDAIARGAEREPPPAPPEPSRTAPEDAPLVALAQALVRRASLHTSVGVELIATQAELVRTVEAARRGEEARVRVLEGWRREVVGAELLELLAGNRSLRVGPDGLEVDG